MNNNGCIIPEIDEQNIGVQQENATFLVIGDEAYTSEIIEEYNRNAAAKTKEFNTNATNKTNDFNTNYDNKLEAFNSNAVTKTEDFDSHVTAQTTNFNNNAETATTNFNRNAVQQTDEFNRNAMSYSQGIEENKKNIASTSNELYRLKTDVLETGESSGNNIHLEDSAWAEMQEIKVDGVCEQETTKGNQLIDFASIGSISCDVKFENDTLEITSNKSYSRASKNITELLQNNVGKVLNFTFESIDFSKTLGGRIQLNILKNDGTHLYQGLVETSGKKFSYTIPNDFSDITSIVLEIYSNNTSENSVSELTILKPLLYFENNNSYEPYTGGQPSPSPDYPQEIKTITNSLKVTSCNKNVFKITSTLKHFIASGVDISINDNVITLNGTAIGAMWPDFIWGIQGNTAIHNKCKYYFSEQPEDCTASINVLSGTATGGSFVITANDDSSSTFSFNFNNLQGSITHKANGVNRAFLSGITSGTKFDNFTFEIMLEKGSVATAFERHIESQIQAKLPEGEFIGKLDETYKDTLRTEYFPKEGQYHLMLDKKVGKIILDGSENIVMELSDVFYRFNVTVEDLYNYNGRGNYAISSHFHSQTDNDYGAIITYQNRLMLYPSDTSITTEALFKTWLSKNKPIVYYVLKTPYTVDLGAIDMPLTYDEITNIFTDSDLLPTINVKYYRNFIATIQNLQVNNDTLKNELSNIESRLMALESANTNIESRLTTLENANKNVADSNPTEESEVTE